MRRRDQKKYFEILKRFEKTFSAEERSKYTMLLKRHKDEEELDLISFQYLKALYEKYYVNRDRKYIDDIFKKKD